jgi:hypothetical protein
LKPEKHTTVEYCLVFFFQADSLVPAVTFTSDQDHQNMMDQLGIKACAPVRAAMKKRPTTPTSMSLKANPFPNLPDPLTLNDGHKVTTAADVVGSAPPRDRRNVFEVRLRPRPQNVPKVTWTVTAVDHEFLGFTPIIAKDLIGQVDNSSYTPPSKSDPHDAGHARQRQGPSARPDDVWPRRLSQSERASRRRSRPHQRNAWKALLVQQDPSLKEIFANIPPGSRSRRRPSFRR